MMFRIRRVLSLTVHTPIPLRTRIGFTGFILTSRCLAFWTFLHNSILAHLFRHSALLEQSERKLRYGNIATCVTCYFRRANLGATLNESRLIFELHTDLMNIITNE